MPFLLTTIAGLSTVLGSIFVFFDFKNKDKIINISLSFAASVMLTISLFDLIPESFNLIHKDFISIMIILISINIGIIVSMLINKYMPDSNNLYRVGVITMLAIIIHNIPEGIATYMATIHDFKLGLTLTVAIALHNIPEGIAISIPIFYAKKSRGKALFYTFISGFSEILGAILASIFFKNIITDMTMAILFGIIAGIMSYISIYELFPEAIKHKQYKITLVSSFVGVIITLISIFLTK